MENKISVVPNDKSHWLKLRHKNVNSTEASCLYGANPYMTEFELYHHKRSEDYVAIEESEPMKWGSRLQDAIAYGVAADQGWKNPRPMKEYIYLNDVRLGSSFDFESTRQDAFILTAFLDAGPHRRPDLKQFLSDFFFGAPSRFVFQH